MLSVLDYYREANAAIAGLTGTALQNARLSMLANSPLATETEKQALAPQIDSTLPGIVVDADGHPQLVVPSLPPAPAPTPPCPAPPPVAVPTPSPIQPVISPPPVTTTPPPAGGTGGCPPGMIPNPALGFTGGGVTPTPGTIEQQVQSAFTEAFTETTAPSPCETKCQVSAPQLVGADDFLVITLWSMFPVTSIVIVTARLLDCNGQVHTYQSQLTVKWTALSEPTNGVICMPLGEGCLLSVSVTCDASCLDPGSMFVTGQLKQGSCSGALSAGLFQGYLVHAGMLYWPGGQQQNWGEGPGSWRWFNYSYTGGDGQSSSFFLPSGAISRVRQLVFAFRTGATAGNRLVNLQYSPLHGPSLFFPSSVPQPPSTEFFYTFAPGAAPGSVVVSFGTLVQIPVPDNMFVAFDDGCTIFIDGDKVTDSLDYGGVAYELWVEKPG